MEPDPTSARLRQTLHTHYGVPAAQIVHAPYRICPLGAHIDHQLGPVTAMAIDRGVTVAVAPTASRTVRVRSLDFSGEVRFSLDDIPGPVAGDWGNFVRGAARALIHDGPLERGLVAVTAGRLDGGGLSSSAAVGVALLLAFETVNRLQISATRNIRLHSRIENDYLGLQIGVLDQAAILLAHRGCLTRIDCATLNHESIPLPPTAPPFTILLAFSGLKQSLASTDYNRRVRECRAAAHMLQHAAGRSDSTPLLGHVPVEQYEQHRHRLPPLLARRAAHFFGEAARVRSGLDAWRRGDLVEFGRLMSASGHSSIANYECGCPPLVDLYTLLVATPGVYGARFSGAGFRGCCLALVDSAAAADIAQRVRTAYARAHPDLAREADVLLSHTDQGARVFPPDP